MARDALSALTAQIVSQSFADKLAEKRRQQRLQALTQSYRSLGFGDKSAAIATRVAAGAPLSSSEKEDILAAGHRDEIAENFPEGFSAPGVSPGQFQRLGFAAAGQRLTEAINEEELNRLLVDFAAGREISKGGDLLEFKVGQAPEITELKNRAVLAVMKLYGQRGANSEQMNMLLTGRYSPNISKKHGVARPAWDKLEELLALGVTSSDDILSLPGGILDLVELKTAWGITSNRDLDRLLGQGEGIEHLYGLAQQSIQSEFELLAGGKEQIVFLLQEWRDMVPDPDNPGQMVSQLKLDQPLVFDFVEKYFNKGDFQNITAEVVGRAEEMQILFDFKKRLSHLPKQKVDAMLEIAAYLAKKADFEVDTENAIETIMREYGHSRNEAQMILDLVREVRSGALTAGAIPRPFGQQGGGR